MNKKLIIIIIVVLLLAGAGVGFWFYKKSSSSNDDTTSTASESSTKSNSWNPYSTESHHTVTLTDQLLSAGNGDFVVKMNITLDFAGDEAYYKYVGYETKKEAEKAEKSSESHSSSKDKVATPMELKINDTIGELMMKANETQIKNRETLRNYLKDGINRELGFDQETIKNLYIENFVIQ
ncbi:flagellar basal body-associated FliL family protein [Bacillus mexicanus]|uniref:flagellar basal body-associated FliL family protein n=1 Tax=Bacillus mexicanus TaxID=2834415 RepID=UPI003D23B8DD